MIEYQKIETVYNRDDKTHRVKVGELRMPEFGNIKLWTITEKVDGTNVRICLSPDGSVFYGGRTDNAQMPVQLLNYLKEAFSADKLANAFEGPRDYDVILFGEGYGEKIQKGGGLYRKGVSFRLFDVLIGEWWLELDSISDIANKLGIRTVPILGRIDSLPASLDALEILTHNQSMVAVEDGGVGCVAEGIVARTSPLLFTRKGERLLWKLKFRDF